MKIKQSFVTNSSSTSFVMVGEEISYNEIEFSSGYDYVGWTGECMISIDEDHFNDDDYGYDEMENYYRVYFFVTAETMEEGMNGLEVENLELPEDAKPKIIYGNMLT